MDVFLKKMDRLAGLAAHRADPAPLDTGGVMARIRGLEIEDGETLSLPIGFFAGGVAAAAVAALAVSIIAATAWSDMVSADIPLDSLIDVMEIIS